MTTKYRLTSTPMFHTPNVMRWYRHVAETDQEMGRHLVTEAFPSLSIEAVDKLLAGEYITNEKEESIEVEVVEN